MKMSQIFTMFHDVHMSQKGFTNPRMGGSVGSECFTLQCMTQGMGHGDLEFESRAQASILVCSSVLIRIDAPMAAELIELMLQGWPSQPRGVILSPLHPLTTQMGVKF